MKKEVTEKDILFCEKCLKYSSLTDRGIFKSKKKAHGRELSYKNEKKMLFSFEVLDFSEETGYEITFTSPGLQDQVTGKGYIFPSTEKEILLTFLAQSHNPFVEKEHRASSDGIEETLTYLGGAILRETYCFSDPSLTNQRIASKVYEKDGPFDLVYFSRFAPIDISHSKKIGQKSR